MNPTLLKRGPYRFYFFSREESRPHVHVVSGHGEAKFWLEPLVALANYAGLKEKELKRLQKIVAEYREEFIEAWEKYFAV